MIRRQQSEMMRERWSIHHELTVMTSNGSSSSSNNNILRRSHMEEEEVATSAIAIRVSQGGLGVSRARSQGPTDAGMVLRLGFASGCGEGNTGILNG
ncbi:hypothetical protein GUJ93_ZPchr0014g46674 [Zizania palustris]|uniref:Uncharacterized protein n=1 Tax=Zizania palustris TaxID=103762 RepID=A0A8J5VUN2_ZIZPA|nr:hypothetical protein GUJ93_ZPchr0014g46674 [Zizania palustris]